MNRTKLKNYAPKARRGFISAVKARAALLGVTGNGNDPVTQQGDVVLIKGRPYPKKVASQRQKLIARVNRDGFDQTIEAVAYTWFNRFAAIRYMELHGFLGHGFRVLSHPDGKAIPEIVEQAEHVDLPRLDSKAVLELRLDGTRDEELYRMLLIAQCNALHAAMPFLFERIDDETELLLPDNLLHTDSSARRMVTEIPQEDWQEIEVIGWLYQFYISEKKDEVFESKKAVPSEDIPAATQLFTPNWIVKYLVQNSLGAQWLATYPSSSLKAQMEYYIEPPEQTEEVNRKQAEITPDNLDPEAMTLIDPACGSGHILVEAYDLFKAIYLERGYRLRDVPRLILEKNIYGLDIDDRAAQLAGFSLLMRARTDDRRILSPKNPPRMNVMSLTDSGGWDAEAMADALAPTGRVELVPVGDLLPETLAQPTRSTEVSDDGARAAIREIVALFDGAKTFGSLITVPDDVMKSLPVLEALLARPVEGDLLQRQAQSEARERLSPLVAQAHVFGRRYDCVVANPPYMGRKRMNTRLKKYAQDEFPDSKSDLFAMFMECTLGLTRKHGKMAMINMQSWMFLSSFEKLRTKLLSNATLLSMAHLGERGFDTIGGAVVSTTAFVFENAHHPAQKGDYLRLVNGPSESGKSAMAREAIQNHDCGWFYRASAEGFRKIPGSLIAYWLSDKMLNLFQLKRLDEVADVKMGMRTGDNARFLREWFEVASGHVGLNYTNAEDARNSGKKWFPHQKGGDNRRWYGVQEYFVNWENDGEEIKNLVRHIYPELGDNLSWKITNEPFFFGEAAGWTALTTGSFSLRYYPAGFVFDTKGQRMFPRDTSMSHLMAMMNSKPVHHCLQVLCPTLDFTAGPVGGTPFLDLPDERSIALSKTSTRLIELSRADWDAYETSWDFTRLSLLAPDHHQPSLKQTYTTLRAHWQGRTDEMQRLEEQNNCLFIDAYDLTDELTPEVPPREITLTCNPHYRYRGDLSDADREARLRADTVREMISYVIGCMMGRYCLSEPGLTYADAGNEGFDSTHYGTFPADDDGIVPITDTEWFPDDATARFDEFLKIAWPPEAINKNLEFVANSLSQKKGESSTDTVRRYLSSGFYKDHLQTYKNRPIYWLFSSGKQRAFECLVYLHRYNEGTLARMRTEYVIPLQSLIRSRIEHLVEDIQAATSTSNRKKLEKEREKLLKQQDELRSFDEELRHYADMRISIDLDNGVKVNYGKFGTLLAERKRVTGEK